MGQQQCTESLNACNTEAKSNTCAIPVLDSLFAEIIIYKSTSVWSGCAFYINAKLMNSTITEIISVCFIYKSEYLEKEFLWWKIKKFDWKNSLYLIGKV